MAGYVYILSNRRNGTLYVGVTNDLRRRVYEHKSGLVPGFTKRYAVKKLVWYEQHEMVTSAIKKEKLMKSWPRKWKLNTIEKMNPTWADLYEGLGLP